MAEQKSRKWAFVTYGTSTDVENNGFAGSVEENTLSVWSMRGRGKLVPASTDGLAFYYTVIDPETENFTLEADLEVESWTYSNGQDGFGLMAADSIGENGREDSFWNNSYMASVTRVDYFYDKERKCPANAGERYFMKLGVGAQEKKGVTRETIAEGTQVAHFCSTMHTLETTAPDQGYASGVYNLVGGYTNAPEKMRDVAALTSFHLSIRRMNGGYVIGYTDEKGILSSRTFYQGEDGDELTRLESGHIYVGFFASRNAKVAVRNVKFVTVSPSQDDSVGERPFDLVMPNYRILSASSANRPEYELVFYGNADGKLLVQDPAGTVLAEKAVQAGVKCREKVNLNVGENVLRIIFTPNEAFCPSRYARLSSYDTAEIAFTVTYQPSEREVLYIGPFGSAQALGTEADPLDIYTAVRGALPGQKLILLPGRYLLERTVVVERGIDGTKERPILLAARDGERAVLDFCGACMGMSLAGDYWHFKGFDVTNTARGEGGVRLCGSHNLVERLGIYRNGNTGFQISTLLPEDQWEDWPSDNVVRNCTAYLNADPGYTDSDGFAAKITVAEGNVLEGCISAYNADDGFDLFAKVERGVTGSVLIKNCVAFKNGYVIDENGKEEHVGLGNGFKLGGSSIACGHRLEHSIAFANGEKGVDSNSCPNDRVSQVISVDNDSHNVALFTTDAKDTAFSARGVLSFRTSGDMPDLLAPRGTQDMAEIYGETNYYQGAEGSVNSSGRLALSEWFVDLDIERAIHGGITRDEEGRILLNGFLELTSAAPADAGTRNFG
ncbi:MAG: right-handed parallel beta-helix repeat-containing protein [Candidatus Gastranaerophilales bacterium]|nr:right-handed parallel beta-helix repeat-containing protein [Candidatus Gastranaerophilales bacterium]